VYTKEFRIASSSKKTLLFEALIRCFVEALRWDFSLRKKDKNLVELDFYFEQRLTITIIITITSHALRCTWKIS